MSRLTLSSLLLSPSAPQVDFKQRVQSWVLEAESSHLPWQINGRSYHRAGGQHLAQPANRIPMSLLTLHRQGCWRLACRTVGQPWFKKPSRSPCFTFFCYQCVSVSLCVSSDKCMRTMKEQKSEYNVFTSRVVHLSFKVQIVMECCYTPSFNFLNLPPNYLVPCSLCVTLKLYSCFCIL